MHSCIAGREGYCAAAPEKLQSGKAECVLANLLTTFDKAGRKC